MGFYSDLMGFSEGLKIFVRMILLADWVDVLIMGF